MALDALKGKSITLPVYGYLASTEVAEGVFAAQVMCDHGIFRIGECPVCYLVGR